MARHRRRSSDRPDDDSPPRTRSRAGHHKTDLSAFLELPLGAIDDAEFESLCLEIRGQLNPRDQIEDGMVTSILRAFRGVRRGLRAVELGTPGAALYLKTMRQSFRSQQECFDLLRDLFGQKSTPIAPPSAPAVPPPAPISEPEPVAPVEAEPESESDAIEEIAEIETAARDWRERIAMVPAIDARWPVVDRIGVTVDEILSHRDRGIAEEELRGRYPDLTYADLAACYECEVEEYRGPLEPPYPDELTVLDIDFDID